MGRGVWEHPAEVRVRLASSRIEGLATHSNRNVQQKVGSPADNNNNPPPSLPAGAGQNGPKLVVPEGRGYVGSSAEGTVGKRDLGRGEPAMGG